MPTGDRTGPLGAGPKTGKSAGFCGGYPAPGYLNFPPGRGFFCGRGQGMGRDFGRGLGGRFRGGRGAYSWCGDPSSDYGRFHPSLQDQRDYLENQLRFLKDQLEMVQHKLSELDQEKA